MSLFQIQLDYWEHACREARSRSVPFRSLKIQDIQNTWKQNNFQDLWQPMSFLLVFARANTCSLCNYTVPPLCVIQKSHLKGISVDCWRQQKARVPDQKGLFLPVLSKCSLHLFLPWRWQRDKHPWVNSFKRQSCPTAEGPVWHLPHLCPQLREAHRGRQREAEVHWFAW